MRARPAGPAQSFVFHNSARRGPTKEAHRRALNRPDGLLRSEAGRGHGRFARTPPRERPDLLERHEIRFGRYTGGLGTHQGRDTGTHQGGIRVVVGVPIPVANNPTEQFHKRCTRAARIVVVNLRDRDGLGVNRPRRGRDPYTRPRSADVLARRGYHPARTRPGQLVRPRPAAPARRGRPRVDGRPAGAPALPRVGPDGPEDTGRAFRPPRSGTRQARALPHSDQRGARQPAARS
jgi:hypothetical protein